MPRHCHKFLTLVLDIINAQALTENLGKGIKFKYFFNTFTTIRRQLHKCIIVIGNVDNFVYQNI